MNKLSVVTIAKNEEKYIDNFLSQLTWVDEIIIIDNKSTDDTAKIARKYTDKVFQSDEIKLGKLKQLAVDKAQNRWILLLDVDEFVDSDLKVDIQNTLKAPLCSVYLVTRQSFFYNHKLIGGYGKEKFIRLFDKNKARIKQAVIHDKVLSEESAGELKGVLNHYSYRNILWTITKFISYALREAIYGEDNESLKLKHFTLYPLHMFWSIFVEDEGYRDHVYGFALASCFAYMEFMRYWFLLLIQLGFIKPSKD